MIKPCAKITLDIQQPSTATFVALKKRDIGRKIIISLSDGGFPYEIADDCYAVLTAKKPDNNTLYNHCEIDGNTIVYEITEQTTAAAGRMKAEVKLYGADDTLITSATFRIIIDGTVYDEGEVESTSEFSALTELILKVTELLNSVDLIGEDGYSIFLTSYNLPYVEESAEGSLVVNLSSIAPAEIETQGKEIKVGDLILSENGVIGSVTAVSASQISVKSFVNICSPHIGENGNWHVGSTDTGVKAQGEDGTSASLTVKYNTSDSKSTSPTQWFDSMPILTEEYPYLWMKVTVTTSTGVSASETGVIGFHSSVYKQQGFDIPATKNLNMGGKAISGINYASFNDAGGDPDCGTYMQSDEGIYDEDGHVTGQVFSFYGSCGDEPVVLRNIHDPIQDSDAATKKFVEDTVVNRLATLTLGQHTDGLIYIFINGQPMGNGLEIGEIKEIVEDPTLLTDIVEYYRTPTQEVVDTVNSYDDSVLSFVVIADTHGSANQHNSQAIVNYMLENSKADKCFWLGDVCIHEWVPDEFVEYATPLLKNKDKIFFAIGNHEYSRADGSSDDMSALVDYFTAQRNPTENFNYYHDDVEHKVRCIIVDTEKQGNNREWIAEAINTLPDGYKYLVFGHTPIGYSDGADGVPWAINDATTSLTILENNPQDCIGYFCGHEHVDAKHIVRNRYWEVCFICDRFDNTNWYDGFAVTDRVVGTISEQAVSVVSINIETGDVIVHRIGAGSGYTYNYLIGECLVTNQLTNVTTDSAVTNVFEGESYTANLTPDDGYEITSVMVTMGGVDITSDAYLNGVVFIENATGDIVITAIAAQGELSYTDEGYIANGLTWQLDGINNTGNGHSSTATEWVDLVNGNNLAMLDPNGLSWGDDCLVVNGSVVYHDDVPVDGLTVELVFQNIREAAENYIGTFAAAGGTPCHILSIRNDGSATFASYSDTGGSNVYTNLGVSHLDKMAITIVYGSANGDAERVYVNGELLTELHNSSYSDSWVSALLPGNRYLKLGGYQTGGGSYGMQGNIYSFRAYNRQLTTDEVRENYAVDVERFFTKEVTYTDEGYIANDLTWQFDGINNTGNGHSSTATEWVDLVNGRTMSLSDTENLSWGEDCLTMTESGYVYRDNEKVNALTVELLFHNKKETGSVVVGTFAGTDEYGTAHMLALSDTDSATFIGGVCNYTNLGVPHTDKMAVTIVYSALSSDAERVYVNGELLTELHNNSHSDSWNGAIHAGFAEEGSCYLSFGRYKDGGSYDMAGDIFSFRAYNSNLTTEEVQANYAVDVERFGLTS